MNVFRVMKKSGTYSDLLEAYGLSNLLHEILERSREEDANIAIIEKNTFYEIQTGLNITGDILEKLRYFPLFRYVKTNTDSDINIIEAYDYSSQKELQNKKKKLKEKIYKDYNGSIRTSKLKELESEYPVDDAFDVYTQIISPNNIVSFKKLYSNFDLNKQRFIRIIKEILNYYTSEYYSPKDFNDFLKQNKISFSKNVTATQLYNPSQGQGLNKLKADGLNRKNFDSFWIPETMKVSGALTDMICQLVKVGSAYDLKVFVPAYRQVNYAFKHRLIPDFKSCLKGNTPIKIDILNTWTLTQKILQHNEYAGKRRKVKDIVSGLYSVYQKDMGQNKAVINMGFIQTPSFVEIGSKEENARWIELIDEQKLIISSMDEDRGALRGLLEYRDFLSASNIDCFFAFVYWFAAFSFNKIVKKQHVKLYSIESLDKLYDSMDTKELKLMEIIGNRGFQAIAKAIRNSTVSLQYAPKESRNFEVRYGVAQSLQTKAKSPEDLATYIGEFVALYNAETARKIKKGGNGKRMNVREDDLNDFYNLLDSYPSYLVGALLASYGFALPQRDNIRDDENDGEENE